MLVVLALPAAVAAHPLGNFSISHYTAIRVGSDHVELRYLIDMAEIPTFQELQATGLVPEAGHPTIAPYLARRAAALSDGLRLEVNGQRLPIQVVEQEAIFPPGAGGLPTLKIGVVYRAPLDGASLRPMNELRYRDENFDDRAGWKEIVAFPTGGVTFSATSVPERDRSRALSDYPVDLLNSPPQDLEAQVMFGVDSRPPAVAGEAGGTRPAEPGRAEPGRTEPNQTDAALRPNAQLTPRNRFTDLVATRELGFGVIATALAVSAALGAFHALEPGHGKTVVAAYLVGARGTARHAVLLGVIVTASHTAGVYLLGGVTFYASRYVVPERLYPWLAVGSGLTIAILGGVLLFRRWTGRADHNHAHDDHDHHHHAGQGHDHGPHPHSVEGHDHGHGHNHHTHGANVSLRDLFVLGVTGGIVPCPAALVVLLSAVSLRRIGFGLVLIVAFSVGLAAVLVLLGLLMVYARRLMARFQEDSVVITRWLPLTSSAVITLVGVVITAQGLVAAGILSFGRS